MHSSWQPRAASGPMSLRHPKLVFQDPQLGFVGFGATSRFASRLWDPLEAGAPGSAPLTTLLPSAGLRRRSGVRTRSRTAMLPIACITAVAH